MIDRKACSFEKKGRAIFKLMLIEFLLGNILLAIHSEIPLPLHDTDRIFLYQGESFNRRVDVFLRLTRQLPEIIRQQVFCNQGIRAGFSEDGEEVREYTASFMSNLPRYAVSQLCKDTITVWFNDQVISLNNPNVYIWNFLHMEKLLLACDALVLHCSYLMIGGKAILFSAPSGTGKTTQAKLWEKLTPGRIINGDKAIVQKRGGTWYACGYPFHGSAEECENEDYPIAAIVVVRQSPEDTIEPLRPMRRLTAVYSECTVNTWDADSVNRALNLVGELVTGVEVVCQHCTMNDEACHTLRRYLEERNLCNCTI